jgi:phosphohistidine phosphatase SixA/8-oxo-dGTP pyrophosphatase MutT (NUDIX family)
VSSSAAAATVADLGSAGRAASATGDDQPVLAAGAVLWRPGADSRPQVALVHRPKYDDWSLPKGKLTPGEHPVAAAVREVAEETGFRAVLGRPLPTQHYVASGRPKQVEYWAARVYDGEFSATSEVDQLVWVPAAEAAARLTHPRDGDVVGAFAGDAADTWALVILRHAKAAPRDSWEGDDLERPLIERGYAQSARLGPLLAAYGVRQLVTSPAKRCRDTLVPYAEQAGLTMDEVEGITEQGYRADGRPTSELVEKLLAAQTPAVVCTHRPVLPGMVAMACAAAEGSAAPPSSQLEAGEFWVLHLAGRRVVAVEQHTPEPPR